MILTSLVNDGFLLTKLLFFFQALHNYILGQFFICVVEILKLNYFTTEIPSGKKTPKYFFEITDELPCRTSVNVLVYRLTDCLERVHLNNAEWLCSDCNVQDKNRDSACCRPGIVLFPRK